ncbi:MAG: MerR family transcriptional regulator [Myxococcales bacterium]|jgi:DNA-binding transcriptional MerR regulator
MSESVQSQAADTEYTIDELSAHSGVPSRTIRFYQAKGVLPAPRKRGRVAIYDTGHLEQLQRVAELQDKGLRLRAIKELLSRKDMDSDALQKWLGVGERLGHLTEDEPKLLTERELRDLLGDVPPGIISRLVRREVIKVQGEGMARRYLIESPALLRVGMHLLEAGVDLEHVLVLYELLQRRLSRAADDVVQYAFKHVGDGFGRSAEPDDIMSLLETIFAQGAGAEAVRLIFTREVQRAVQERLQSESQLPPRRRNRR